MRAILPILLIILAVASFVLFTNPLWQDFKRLAEERRAFNEALASSKQFQALRGELLNRFNAFSRADLERLNRLLPVSPDSIRLITQIERIASDHGFVITNIKFEEPKPPAETRFIGEAAPPRPYQIFNLEFSLSGGRYSDFVALLSDLERSLRLIDISSLTFTATTRTGLPPGAPTDLYNYNFKIRTYWFSS